MRRVAQYCKIKSTSQKDAAVRGKAYVMLEAADGRWYPMDPTFPLSGPASIARSGVDRIAAAEYGLAKATERMGQGGGKR